MNKLFPIKLNELLLGFVNSDSLSENPEVSGLAVDSRLVKQGDLFFACKGVNVDGCKYIKQAVDAGAVAVVCESESDTDISVPVCVVENLNQRLGEIAARFYQQPSAHNKVVGITGTNGKTSCSHILAQCLTQLGLKCGVIGTMGAGVWGQLQPLPNTTPGAVELQKLLAQLREDKSDVISMEVSSHGLEQYRVVGCEFDIAVFTNLSRDHLDYHGDMASYGASKLKLFREYGIQKNVINLDDEFAQSVIAALPKNVTTICTTLNNSAAVASCQLLAGKIAKADRSGTSVHVTSEWGAGEFHSTLLGEFNMSNLLNVLAMLILLDVPFDHALKSLEAVQAPSGRMETYFNNNTPLIVVDYAHTPDALEKTLLTLKRHTDGELFVLFGCGGDRDRGKRSQMGVVAEQLADQVWLTNDNPRTEIPSLIIEDILSDFIDRHLVVIELDRAKAIRGVITAATVNDIVLIAGKGHEATQIIGAEQYNFSDRELVSNLIKEAA